MSSEELIKALEIAFNIAVMGPALGWIILRHTRLGRVATGALRFVLNLSALSVFVSGLAEHPGDPFRWFVLLGWTALMLCDDYGIKD